VARLRDCEQKLRQALNEDSGNDVFELVEQRLTKLQLQYDLTENQYQLMMTELTKKN